MNLFKRGSKRAIKFPQEASLGRLYYFDRGNYTFFAIAQGTVLAPAGVPLQLRVTREVESLSPLLELEPADLSGLSFSHTNRTDNDLQFLSSLTGLTALHLDYTEITGEGLRGIVLNPYFFSARHSRFSDEGARHLKRMPGLQVINLSASLCTDAALGHLAELPALHTLFLAENRIDGTCGSSLACLKALSYLYLAGTKFADPGLKAMGSLPELVTLELERSAVNGSALESVHNFPKLSELGLSHTAVSDQALERLRGHQAIRKLSLSATAITYRALECLSAIPNLQSLDLSYTQIRDEDLRKIPNLTSLKYLDLRSTATTSAGLACLSQFMPGLRINWAPPAAFDCPRQLVGKPLFVPANHVSGARGITAVAAERFQ